MPMRIIQQGIQGTLPDEDQDWLDLEHLVQVELTSEDPEYPIDSQWPTGAMPPMSPYIISLGRRLFSVVWMFGWSCWLVLRIESCYRAIFRISTR